jgi:Skp family chaperone for outer membrane proteins
MRVWRLAIFALVAVARAQAADFPETHLLLVDRHAMRLSDARDDDVHFATVAAPIYKQLLARHSANLILDSSAAPVHWSGLDVTAEAIAALQAGDQEPAGAPASFVRMVFADLAPSDLSDPKFHETLEHIAAGKAATLVVDRKAVIIATPGFDVTQLVRSTLETYRNSGTLPLVVGGPDVPPAHAAILDRTALIRGSAADRGIAEQIRAITASAESELRRESDTLKRDGAALKQQIPSLTPKARSQAVQDFTARQKAFTAKVQERQRAITAAAAQAQKTLEVAAGPIVLRLLNDGHANVVLDRMAVVADEDALDITAPAIAQLNAALPRVEVTLQPAQK